MLPNFNPRTSGGDEQNMHRMTRKFLYGFWMALIATTLTASGYAQTAGSIQGTVTDPTGAAVANCQVTITNVGTQEMRNASCGANGYYVVPQLQPGEYDVTAVAPGFEKLTRPAQTLEANQPLTVNLQLKIGAASQTVTVSGAAVQVNTTTATISQVITGQSIVGLPLLNRNAAALVNLVAGSTTAPISGAQQSLSVTTLITPSLNGSRGNQTSYMLDGALNVDTLTNVNAPFPFPDALQEFSVQTANYSAAYGQTSGAVVNIATKSGTNSLHGDVFDFERNAVLNAIGYFNFAKDQLKQHQFGATIGGPVVLPFYNGRNRTFFFGGFQKRIQRDTNGSTFNFVPTAANMTGDFSALLDPNSPANPFSGQSTQLYYPNTNTPIPGNIIDLTTHPYDPAFLNLDKLLPAGDSPNGRVGFVSPNNATDNEYLIRIDQKVGSKDQITGRYYHFGNTLGTSFIPGNFLSESDSRYVPYSNFMVKETHVFGPNVLNVAHFSRTWIYATSDVPSGVPTYSSLGVKLNQDFVGKGNMGMYAYNALYAAGSWTRSWKRETYQYGDDVHWIHGKHSLGFGALAMRSSFVNHNAYGTGPEFTFSGEETGGLNLQSPGFSLASMALGSLDGLIQGTPQLLYITKTYIGLYAEDNYHAAPRLTLNFGMRWEPVFPWVVPDGEIAHFSPAAYTAGIVSTKFPNAPPGVSFPGDPGFPNGKSGVGSNMIGFAPRVGFAYDVHGNGKESIRGGFGMFYETSEESDNHMGFIAPPFNQVFNLDKDQVGTFSDPYGGTVPDPFPAPPPSPASTFPPNPGFLTYDPFHYKYQTPVNYEWNLTFERQLTENWLARLAYVGSHGSHGLEIWRLNPAVFTPGGNNGTGSNARRLFPGVGDVRAYMRDVNSSYNALQVTMQKRVSHGFSVLANYTWSKSLDDAPVGVHVNSGGIGPAIPWNMPDSHRLEYGPSDWDRTNLFVVSYLWNLPSLSGSNRFVRAVLGNWGNTGIVTWQSGDPITVMAGADRSRTGSSADRAQIVPNVNPYGGDACQGLIANGQACKNWLNPAAFALPALGTFGNVQKGSYRGPRYFDYDTNLFKDFPIHDRFVLQFRAEFFNVLNNTNYSDPNNSVTGQLGAILSANSSPRIGQLALKLKF